MSLRVAIELQARDGRVQDAVELMTRINACIVDMGGPQGQLFQTTTGPSVGGGLGMVHDFEDLTVWAQWEQTALENEKFAALFAEVLDPAGPIVTPFKRDFWRSLP